MADTLGNFSPYAPYFYFDCGIDQLWLRGTLSQILMDLKETEAGIKGGYDWKYF